MNYRVGVDIGGTFTDFSILDERGRTFLWKEDSDPEFPARAIQRGLAAVSREMGFSQADFLSRVRLFVHGTTIATNMLIQRNGPRVGLLCTEGFRDVLYTRDAFKPERFNVHLPYPEPFVDRYLRLGVRERVNRLGEIVTPLDEAQVRAAAATFREADVGAVAVAFLWSIANADHEHRAVEILREELPGTAILCSVDILPELREWERTSAAVLSAYMLPGVSTYLRELEQSLARSGYGRGPLIMQINGGVASVPEILRKPVNILASGPAAAPAASLYSGSLRGLKDLVIVDMGGTSLDVCLVREGRAAMSRDIQVENQPIGVPGVEVLSVGAGGGSIGWVDDGGALRVGPRSAGSRPGPVAYDHGGTEPTVTDANIALGFLDPQAFLGGRRVLRADLSEAALAKVGGKIGKSALETAAGIIRIVNANMVAAIRAVSVQRGIDVRGFTMLAGGGAGGLHAVALARAMEIEHVLIPQQAGTLCAFGMTVTDVRYDESAVHHCFSNAEDVSELAASLASIEAELRERLRAEGFDEGSITIERSVDARYPGQVHQLTVPAPSGKPFELADLATIKDTFDAEHKSRFTYSRPEMPVEFLHWRVAGIGTTSGKPLNEPAGAAVVAPVHGWRLSYDLDSGEMVNTAVYHADALVPGATLSGPAIIQAPTTTILIGTGDKVTVDPNYGLSVEVRVGRLVAELA
jgi:N-methylhydantoinase A